MADQQLSRYQTRRERKTRIFIDSRDQVTHENNNPSNYTYRLGKIIPNVIRMKLLSYRVPYSPTFVVIRTSKWMAPDALLDIATTDTLHQKADALALISASVDVEKSSRRVSLYKADGTVSLNVVEVFSFSRTRTETDYAQRTYDVYICTGTVATSSRVNWRLQDPSAITDFDLPITGSESDTASAGYAASDAGSSSIAMALLEENLYLKLNIGQGIGRLSSIRAVYPSWKSFWVYRRGDFVCYSGSCYICLKNHVSLIFSGDIADGNWKVHPNTTLSASAPAQDVFYVVETNEDNEVVILATPQGDQIEMEMSPTNVSTIEVAWKTRRGSNYVFPHTTAIDFRSFTDSANVAELKKEYLHHTIQLEMTYLEETEVLMANGGGGGSGGDSSASSGGRYATSSMVVGPGLAMSSSSPFTLPTRQY